MKYVVARDTLRIHFTIIGKSYVLIDEDQECYKIIDERGHGNWIPKRYMTPTENQESAHEKDKS